MSMAFIQFYRNPYTYPDYQETLSAYGSQMESTPVGVNLKSGKLRIRGDMDDFMSCNYIKITRDNSTLWAWVDNVEYNNDSSFIVSYSVDAWRTYKHKINLGTQWIDRAPGETSIQDPLLGSTQAHPNITSSIGSIGNPAKRVLVVQVRVTLPVQTLYMSRTPVHPTPYHFYFKEYDVNGWNNDTAITQLMEFLQDNAKTTNIVTMYSIPYINTGSMVARSLPISLPNDDQYHLIPGFRALDGGVNPSSFCYNTTLLTLPDPATLTRKSHKVQIVIPEAGILDVPDELLGNFPLLQLRQDVDIFSGACNYMIVSGSNNFQHSVRGSSISSIAIVSDPLDTYMSQNQNALSTALIGDVASIVGGAAIAYGTGGAGIGMAAGMWGNAINNIISRNSQSKDMGERYVNPPAFLGTALATSFNGKFWVVVTEQDVTNETIVHQKFGYPQNMFAPLVFPSAGYIKTTGCNVYSTDGSVPRWALEEVNGIFDNGILVRT